MLAAAGWIGFTFFRRKVRPLPQILLPNMIFPLPPAHLCRWLSPNNTVIFPFNLSSSSGPLQSYYDLGGRRRRRGDEPDGIEVP